MDHKNIKVTGKVQGVFFRAKTKDKAKALGVKGFVRNEEDGSVYIEAEADPEVMKMFLEYCKEGPAAARVEDVAVEDGEVRNFTTFAIQY